MSNNATLSRTEALADALAAYNDYSRLDKGRAYAARNPGNLHAFLPRHGRPRALRVFGSLMDGYRAFLFDLSVKCGGKSRDERLGTLQDLVRSYGLTDTTALYVARYLRRVLSDPTITPDTLLSYFVEVQ